MVHQSVFSDIIGYRGHVIVTSMCKIIESIAILIQYHSSRFATEFRIWYRLSAVLTQSIANAWERSKSRLQSCKHLSKQVILMFHPPLLDSSQPASSVCATYCLKQRQVSLCSRVSQLNCMLLYPCQDVDMFQLVVASPSRLKCLDDLRSHEWIHCRRPHHCICRSGPGAGAKQKK